jgi:hypothetical protein
MPLFYKIYKERRLVMSTGSGVVTFADGLAHQEKLRKDPDFAPTFSQLMDLSQVIKIEVTSAELARLARASAFAFDSRRAAVVTNDFAFGLARMFEMHRNILGEKGIRIFRNLDAALDWVLAKAPVS